MEEGLDNNKWDSELPLVFTKGLPKSLEMLDLEELQRFLVFVLKCCDEPELESNVENGGRAPVWWPSDIPYASVPLLHTNDRNGNIPALLKKIIRSCYVYHNATYLLEFSCRLMKYTKGQGNHEFCDNQNGTRTLRNLRDGKVLVTFRAENQDYDANYIPTQSHVDNPVAGSSNCQISNGNTADSIKKNYSFPARFGNPIKLQKTFSSEANVPYRGLPTIQDVYLCDTCGVDFESFTQLLDHEQTCDSNLAGMSNSDMENTFFKYFGLQKGSKPPTNPVMNPRIPKYRVQSYASFLSLPLSSPIGKLLLRNQSKADKETDKIDFNALTSDKNSRKPESQKIKNGKDPKGKNKKVRTEPLNTRRKSQSKFVHSYCFTLEERRRKFILLETGLTARTQWYLRMCNKKKVEVRIKKLTGEEIAKWTKVTNGTSGIDSQHVNNFPNCETGNHTEENIIGM